MLTLVQEHICTVSQENVIHSQWPVAGPFWSRSTKVKEVESRKKEVKEQGTVTDKMEDVKTRKN